MDAITVALWSTNLGRPLSGLDAWLSDVDARLTSAAEAGAGVLLAPEYWCEQWLAFKPEGLRTDQEVAWMAAQAPEALSGLRLVVAERGVALLAGTMPWAMGDGSFVNRAHLLTPEGDVLVQDKLFLTPSEKAPAPWALTPGSRIALLDWRGLRLAVLICLDVEVPAFSSLMAPYEPDLLLVPSMTSYHSGYHRVFGCARARAVELMTAVAAAGTVGVAPGATYGDTNVSGAALFVPCERSLGMTGVWAEHPPVGDHDGIGPWVVARDVPIAEIRRLRREGGEVWPGAVATSNVAVRVEAGASAAPETELATDGEDERQSVASS